MASVFAAFVVEEEDDPENGDIVTVTSGDGGTPMLGQKLTPFQ